MVRQTSDQHARERVNSTIHLSDDEKRDIVQPSSRSVFYMSKLRCSRVIGDLLVEFDVKRSGEVDGFHCSNLIKYASH